MGPLHHPTATDGGSSRTHTSATAERDDADTQTGGTERQWELSQDVTAPAPAPSAQEPEPAAAAEEALPTRAGRSDECQEVRALMPEHLFHTLSYDLDQKVVAHVRLCVECHSVLMDLQFSIEAAAEEAKARRRAR